MRRNSRRKFKALVIGVSTGGVSALKFLLGELPELAAAEVTPIACYQSLLDRL